MPVDIAKGPSDNFLEYAMVLDKTFLQIDLIDTFESFYWTERYNEFGVFEMVMPVLEKHLASLRVNNYLAIRESDRYMIIEKVVLTTDPEHGDTLTISGRSLESILDRRIIWGVYSDSGPVQEIIANMIRDNLTFPSIANRRIPNIWFVHSDDPIITTPTEQVKMIGAGLYESIETLCKAHNLGFKMLPYGEGIIDFLLYAGFDRSRAQNARTPVIFSHSFENLLDSNYIQTEVDYVSHALVRGDEDDIMMEVLREPERIGLSRREMFIDTNLEPYTQGIRVPVYDDDGNPVYDENGNVETRTETIKIYDQFYYDSMLAIAKGEMSKHKITEAFDSEVDTTHQFFYGVDYNVGDIVQVENRYGFGGRCRVVEVMRSRDANGPKLVPTFVMVDENGDEVTTG